MAAKQFGFMAQRSEAKALFFSNASAAESTNAVVSFHQEMFVTYADYRAFTYIWHYVPPVLLLVGVPGNLVTIVVLRRMWPRPGGGSAQLPFLQGLAAADLCLLLSGLLFDAAFFVLQSSSSEEEEEEDPLGGRLRAVVSCRALTFAMSCSSSASAWFLVAVTAQRAASVLRPWRTASSCSVARCHRVVAGIVTLVCLLHGHILIGQHVPGVHPEGFCTIADNDNNIRNNITVHNNSSNTYTNNHHNLHSSSIIDNNNNTNTPIIDNNNHYNTHSNGYDHHHSSSSGDYNVYYNYDTKAADLASLWSLVDLVASCALPCLLLVLCNVLLVRGLRRSERKLRHLAPRQRAGSRRRVTSSMTTAVPFLSLSFVCLTGPMYGYVVWCQLRRHDMELDPALFARAELVWAVTNMLWYANSTCNFLLYCASGGRFRSQLVLALRPWLCFCCCCRCRSHHRTRPSGNSPPSQPIPLA